MVHKQQVNGTKIFPKRPATRSANFLAEASHRALPVSPELDAVSAGVA
jgi:hypothetical protein